ncbi:hypothetical protein I6J77_11160 [Rhodanobacter sp. FDAARGOS 1247]|uniref:hypothetical protein n=1 Tax=Rhodanobacter sp. FDAARGOS 1247 TaxID=2778082 RepID=UPI00194DC4BC|nr:hypothetical protein [Rhodanobacter sp. FDAARGOS 1247]QRP62696.1 hypothetical protein I6J77_11160 [Rhodanobacter sp. FDAARGOS 1247]
MSIKKFRDPAGLLPVRVRVNIKHGSNQLDIDAIASILKSNSPTARIQQLRRHHTLRSEASALKKDYLVATTAVEDADNKLTAEHKAALKDVRLKAFMIRLESAEKKSIYLDAAEPLIRDKARQEGTKKERRPDVTEWISAKLRRDPLAKSPELWSRAPEWLTDQIGYERFRKRVTAVRMGRK